MTKILIAGIGGVGGYFGGLLAKHYYNNSDIEIHFIARGGTAGNKVGAQPANLAARRQAGNSLVMASTRSLPDDGAREVCRPTRRAKVRLAPETRPT